MGLGAALTENRRLHLRGERRQCGVPGDGVGGCVGMGVWGSVFPREVESLLLEIWDLGPPPPHNPKEPSGYPSPAAAPLCLVEPRWGWGAPGDPAWPPQSCAVPPL